MQPTPEQVMTRLNRVLRNLNLNQHGYALDTDGSDYYLTHAEAFEGNGAAFIGAHPVAAYHNLITYANLYWKPERVSALDFTLNRLRKIQAEREANRQPGRLYVGDWLSTVDYHRANVKTTYGQLDLSVELEFIDWRGEGNAPKYARVKLPRTDVELIPPLRLLNPGIGYLFANEFEIAIGLVQAKPE
jgi:hypothetical protein